MTYTALLPFALYFFAYRYLFCGWEVLLGVMLYSHEAQLCEFCIVFDTPCWWTTVL